MKIHVMSGWDLPNTSVGGSGSTSARGAIPNTMFELFATNGDEVLSVTVDAQGWLNQSTSIVATNWGNWRNRMAGNVKSVIPSIGPTSNIFHGIRHRVAFAPSPDNHFVSYMNSYDAAGANALTVFAKADLPGYALNKVYYLEHQLDFANGVVNRWVDSKALAPLPMPAFMLTAVSATPGTQELWLALGAIAGSNTNTGTPGYHSWRDMYYIEWEGVEKRQPLGAVVVSKLPILDVAATAWTPSTGTNATALKTGYSQPSTPVTAPTVTTDDPMTPGTITYDASSVPVNAKVRGITIKGRSAVSAAATGNLGISAVVDGVETPDANTAMVAAQTFYQRMHSSDKNPSGQPWTQPNLAGLLVKVKPKV